MGSRRTRDGVERVYEAAKAWVDRALRADDSLFTPSEAIWSSRWLGEVHRRFLDQPDESKDSFLAKLERQLEGSPPEVYQLIGEALYFHFLIVSAKNSANEQRVIDAVLGWSPSPVAIPADLVAGLTPGIATPGQNFHSRRPFQVGFLMEFVEQWKEQEAGERDRLLGDPWAFKDFAMGLELRSELLKGNGNRARAQREALLHLVHPDTFEGTVSIEHKEKIARTFKHFVTEQTEDLDRKLEQIRRGLEAEKERAIHFYDDEFRRQWDTASPPNPNLWDDFVRRARAFYASGRLDSYEVDYKLEIGGKLEAAREAVLAGAGSWPDLLKGALKTNEVNFVSWRLISNLNQWCADHPDGALTGLQFLWTRDASSIDDRIRDFCELMPQSVASGTGSRTNVASALLMGMDAHQYPPFRVRLFNAAYQQTGYSQPERDADEAALYEHALGFLDRFMAEAEKRGLTMRHHLDAQSYVWGILEHKVDVTNEDEDPDPPPPTDPWASDKVAALAEKLLWEPRTATGNHRRPAREGPSDLLRATGDGQDLRGPCYCKAVRTQWR